MHILRMLFYFFLINLFKASPQCFNSYGKSQGSFPSFPIPMSLQAAAMRRTGFFCSFSQLVSISSSTQAKQNRKGAGDQALHRETRLCVGTIYWGLDSVAAHRVQAPYWTRSVLPQ